MKRMIFPTLAIITSALLFAGCKDDDDNNDDNGSEQTTDVSRGTSWYDLAGKNSWLSNFPTLSAACHNVTTTESDDFSCVRVEVIDEADKVIADYEKSLKSSGFNASFAPHGKIIGANKYYVDIAYLGNSASFSFYEVAE